MTLKYRRATTEDAALLTSLEAKVENPRIYAPTLTLEGAIRDISENTFYFIYQDATPVGTMAYRYVEDGGAYLSNVAVDPAYQRQGIARLAVLRCLTECRDAPYCFLVTHPDNGKALALYQSLGFIVKDRRENYFGDGEPRLTLSRHRAPIPA